MKRIGDKVKYIDYDNKVVHGVVKSIDRIDNAIVYNVFVEGYGVKILPEHLLLDDDKEK